MSEPKKLSPKQKIERHIKRAKLVAANLEPREIDGKKVGVTKKVHGAGIVAMVSSDNRHFIFNLPNLSEDDVIESSIKLNGKPAIEVFPEEELMQDE